MAIEKEFLSRVQHKHDSETNWNKAVNFAPKMGELIVYDKDSTHTYQRLKLGDGTTKITELPFINVSPAQLEALMGAANGIATLGTDSKVPTSQLPSAALLALGETSSSAYYGDKGKVAYDHSQTTHAPSNAEKNQNAFANIVVGSTTIAADTTQDSLTLASGDGITITPDATNDKVTIKANIDTTLSTSSTNSVQNKVIATKISSMETEIARNDLQISSTQPAFTCMWFKPTA